MTRADFAEKSKSLRLLVEKELNRIFAVEAAGVYSKLREAMFYSLEAGGKRIRPCLVLAVCEMLGGTISDALPFACGMEMIHTYSLIHDDMPGMDNDDMRRGRPSNHKVFGEGIALQAGDGLLSFAFEIMLKNALRLNKPNCFEAVYEIARRSGAAGMVSGQAADKENETLCVRTDAMLNYIHSRKTADMLEAAVVSGALLAGADADTLNKLRQYSSYMGLLFQITDDLLDYTGDEKLMGKTLGKDLAEGKLTFVTLYGIDRARDEARTAAEKAKASVKDIPNSGYLTALIDDLLIRNN